MNRSIVAFTVLAITLVGVLVGLIVTSRQLPERVASHFNAEEMPDGWVLRDSYLWSMAGMAVGMAAFLVGIFYSIRFFPPSLINLPHRDYWLAPDRRRETLEFMFCAGVWLAIFEVVFLFAVHLLVVAANASRPVSLSSSIWLLVAGFLLATIGWLYFLIRRFYRGRLTKRCS
jgi:hypothetical protein